MQKNNLSIDTTIINKIFHIRGKKVMLDRDLAEMYGVETKILNQAVKRNINRFPIDFMFQLSENELENWRSQIVTSNKVKMGLRKKPLAFTEQGVAMLSGVLNSEQAIAVNIRIMRVFTSMREIITSNKGILLKLEKLEKKMLHQDDKNKKYENDIQLIFRALKKLLETEPVSRNKIGYKRKNES